MTYLVEIQPFNSFPLQLSLVEFEDGQNWRDLKYYNMILIHPYIQA